MSLKKQPINTELTMMECNDHWPLCNGTSGPKCTICMRITTTTTIQAGCGGENELIMAGATAGECKINENNEEFCSCEEDGCNKNKVTKVSPYGALFAFLTMTVIFA